MALVFVSVDLDKDFSVFDFHRVDANVILAGHADGFPCFDIETPLMQRAFNEAFLDDESLGETGRPMTAFILRCIDVAANFVQTNQV